LEVATDSAFAFPVWNANLTLTEYQRAQDLAAGRYFWRVKASNACGVVLSKTQSFTVFESNLNVINGIDVGVEPIPSKDRVVIHLSAVIDGASIELYRISGQLLKTFVPDQAFQDLSLDLSAFPSGMYLLRLKHRQSSVGLLVILQR
jgi:Secretion system C-terminal sorting domain